MRADELFGENLGYDTLLKISNKKMFENFHMMVSKVVNELNMIQYNIHQCGHHESLDMDEKKDQVDFNQTLHLQDLFGERNFVTISLRIEIETIVNFTTCLSWGT